jgi:hypothetical protein
MPVVYSVAGGVEGPAAHPAPLAAGVLGEGEEDLGFRI